MARVLHVIPSMDRGGAETFIMNIYRHIDRSKLQFDFLLYTDQDSAYNDEIRALGGKIFSVSARNKGFLKNRLAVDEFFRTHPEYRIVHQHVSSLTYVTPLTCAHKYGVPVRIVHCHNTREAGSSLHHYLHLWNQRTLKSYATDYFACSEAAARWLCGKEQYKAGKYAVINNAIEADRFVYDPELRGKMRLALGVENKFVVGHVGRFFYQKNHAFLVDIFKVVHDHHPEAVLLLVGDGELREEIEMKIRDLGLQDFVIMAGVRSDIPDLLQAMDVFVVPSHYEGLCIALIEAQAAGLSCLASASIPVDAAITGLVEMIALDKGAEFWAEKVNRVFDHQERGNTLDQIIAQGYDVGEVARHLQDLYLDRLPENC